MALSRVCITQDVFAVMCAHALTTEHEEIMGLLLGDVQVRDGKRVACIWGVSVQVRSDKRRDRVEISPENQSSAMQEAEKLGQSINRPTNVVGWYHSHPHITVLPSHVDCRTQFQNQRFSSDYVGLILSCFTKTKIGNALVEQEAADKLELGGFQAIDCHNPQHSLHPTEEAMRMFDLTGDRYQRVDIPVDIAEVHEVLLGEGKNELSLKVAHIVGQQCRLAVTQLQENLFLEEQAVYKQQLAAEAGAYGGPSEDAWLRCCGGDGDADVKEGHSRASKRRKQKKSSSNSNSTKSSPGREHPLTSAHHAGVYNLMLCQLQEYCCQPWLDEAGARPELLRRQLQQVQQSRDARQKRIAELERELARAEQCKK